MNERRTMHRWTVSFFAIPVFVLSVCLTANGAPIFVETFDNGNLGGTGTTGSQFETGLDLSVTVHGSLTTTRYCWSRLTSSQNAFSSVTY